MHFVINPSIFTHVSPLQIGVLVLSNINTQPNSNISQSLSHHSAQIIDQIKTKFATPSSSSLNSADLNPLSTYPVIHRWREIYKSFGEKKARSSIESLIRRLLNGHDLPHINPLVDIYNLASLKFELPCGGEDLLIISPHPLELTFADGTENFISLGETTIEHPNPGEIVYKFASNSTLDPTPNPTFNSTPNSSPDPDTIVCRNFNYRESDLTKLTPDTTDAIVVFEDVTNNTTNLQTALDWTSQLTQTLLGAKTIKSAILTSSCNRLER